jgi:hypothetical protein
MNLGLILSLIKLGLEVFQDERKDRFTKKYLQIKDDYQNELNKGIDNWSDLTLCELRFEAEQLGALIVAEHSKK